MRKRSARTRRPLISSTSGSGLWVAGAPMCRVSNCLENQADRLTGTRHGVALFSIALRIVSSFRIQAVNANFFASPPLPNTSADSTRARCV